MQAETSSASRIVSKDIDALSMHGGGPRRADKENARPRTRKRGGLQPVECLAEEEYADQRGRDRQRHREHAGVTRGDVLRPATHIHTANKLAASE